ncbi:XRE family transcriptional regulator [Mycolicibacterium komossense]|uniref:XRE family transcriptional regulator n=1 Tax=Mycolicibacterium komossense TaxID=1779 RepID=A0ABT3CMG1_9MYCO|nr:XRE family transcriptional regulator [Mycolicibacterium komossense]
MVVRYLGVNEVAARTGLSPNTVKSYSGIPGRMPQPDAMIGRVKGWLPETIDRWMERRSSGPNMPPGADWR